MHTRRLVAFLLGVWLGGMLLVTWTTRLNNATVKTLLDSQAETPRRFVELSGRDRAAVLLRFNAAEANRSLIQFWELVQVGLGLAVLATLPFAMRLKWLYLIAAGFMFLIVIGQRTFLTPEMIGIGRLIDSVVPAKDALAKQRSTFATLRQLYIAGEIFKAAIGIGLTGALLVFRQKGLFRSRAERRSEKADRVDDSNYSHVDR